MGHLEEIADARLSAARADAQVAARAAGVLPDRVATFLRLVDLSGNPDEAAIRDRVKAALADVPEFDSRRRPAPWDRTERTDGTGPTDLQGHVSAALAGMQAAVGIVPPASSTPAARPDVKAEEVADLAAAMRHSAGIA